VGCFGRTRRSDRHLLPPRPFHRLLSCSLPAGHGQRRRSGGDGRWVRRRRTCRGEDHDHVPHRRGRGQRAWVTRSLSDHVCPSACAANPVATTSQRGRAGAARGPWMARLAPADSHVRPRCRWRPMDDDGLALVGAKTGRWAPYATLKPRCGASEGTYGWTPDTTRTSRAL
jgi:hypothetical protein